jgi:hypothetical protein
MLICGNTHPNHKVQLLNNHAVLEGNKFFSEIASRTKNLPTCVGSQLTENQPNRSQDYFTGNAPGEIKQGGT